MKLSIEEKAKRYDKAIQRANELNYVSDKDSLQCKTVEHIFPELKESKDDIIRKRIIDALHGDVLEMSEIKEAVDWLEKQGEPTEINPTEFDSQLNKLLKQFEALPKEELANSLSFYLNVIQNDGTYKEEKQGEKTEPIEDFDTEFERQISHLIASIINKEYSYKKAFVKWASGALLNYAKQQIEQKPVDKVEPKFHEGECIIFNGTTLYIKEVVKGYYRTISKGGIPNSYDWDIDNVARLWTIQDAKDGDVLVTNNKNIFIFKSISGCTIYDYCGLYFGKFLKFSATVNGEASVQLPIDYVPATKKQHDLLFQKMKEAGYEWDAEQKQLKKIEQKLFGVKRKKMH